MITRAGGFRRLFPPTPAASYVGEYTNNYVYDGWNLHCHSELLARHSQFLPVGIRLEREHAGSGRRRRIVGGELLRRNNGELFCGVDGNGNVSALVNAADATTLANYEYGPFGEVIRATGPMAKLNPFRFSTKYDDDETDFLYYGYRYYNPSTGRWPSRDPIYEKGGLNIYTFVKDNPIGTVDKIGLTYTISNLKTPYGSWIISLKPLIHDGEQWQGFRSMYIPEDGQSGKQPCPCAIKDIILVQVIDAGFFRSPAHLDSTVLRSTKVLMLLTGLPQYGGRAHDRGRARQYE